MEVRHRIRDFHHRESFPRSRLHEIMFPRPGLKRRRVGRGGGLFNRRRPAGRIFNGRLPRRTASEFSSPAIGDASPKYSATETLRLRLPLFPRCASTAFLAMAFRRVFPPPRFYIARALPPDLFLVLPKVLADDDLLDSTAHCFLAPRLHSTSGAPLAVS